MEQIKIWKEDETKELNNLIQKKLEISEIKKHFSKHSEYDIENKLFILKLNKQYNPKEKFVNKQFNEKKEIKFFIEIKVKVNSEDVIVDVIDEKKINRYTNKSTKELKNILNKRIEICKKELSKNKDNEEYKSLLEKLDYSKCEEKEDYIRKILNTKLTPKEGTIDDLKLRVADLGIVAGKSTKKELLELLGDKVSNKKVKDLNAPKKPLTSFFKFSRDNKAEILKSNPGIKSTEVSKIAGKMWKALDSEEKEKYDQEYKKGYDIYREKFNEYKGIKPKDPNIPVKPLTQFLKYCEENRKILKKENPNLKPGEISTLLSNKWKELDEDKKEIYKENYEKELKIYKKELKKYNKEKDENKEEKSDEE